MSPPHSAESGALAVPLPSLRDRLDRCEGELIRVRRALDETQTRAAALERAHAAAEAQRAEMAKLLVATLALHSTLERDAVLAGLQEILINLVGSEDFAVFETEPGGALSLSASFGADPARAALCGARVGEVLRSGEPHFATAEGEVPAACVPLALDGRVVGVIAVYTLLPQKPGLEPFDHELFSLLATHAATALQAARLHGAWREEVPA